MAVTASLKKRMQAGELQIRVVDLTLDNSYPTGGWAVTPQQLGLGLNGVVWFVMLPEINGFTFEWDYVNNKLKAFWGGGAGAANAQYTNAGAALNAVVIRILAFGVGNG